MEQHELYLKESLNQAVLQLVEVLKSDIKIERDAEGRTIGAKRLTTETQE